MGHTGKPGPRQPSGLKMAVASWTLTMTGFTDILRQYPEWNVPTVRDFVDASADLARVLRQIDYDEAGLPRLWLVTMPQRKARQWRAVLYRAINWQPFVWQILVVHPGAVRP
jgi:hypothetical protein